MNTSTHSRQEIRPYNVEVVRPPEPLQVAVRVWAERTSVGPRRDPDAPLSPKRARPPRWPSSNRALVLDVETTTDAAQAPNFGIFRDCVWRKGGLLTLLAEGVFFADDLPERDPPGFATLMRYAEDKNLLIGSLTQFIEEVFLPAYRDRALIAGFNLPFDLSRLFEKWGNARKSWRGGFSAEYFHRWRRFRIRIRHRDATSAAINLTATRIKKDEQIPEGSTDGRPKAGSFDTGHFLDLRTATYVLTDKKHSLASAAETFGTKHRKSVTSEHGRITATYLDYARNDVLVTAELLEKVRQEYDRYDLDWPATWLRSPASLAKQYLRAMDITPALTREPDFDRETLGYTMSAFYGGRSECHARKTLVPVVYCDFLSMYPTVNSLMGLWEFLTAERVDVVDATDDVRTFLENATLEDMFKPEAWQRLPAIVQIEPDGDILPVRAHYDAKTRNASYDIGLNMFTAREPFWYTLADCVASKLLTGRGPRVLKGLRFMPVGRQPGLRPIKLRGALEVDPERDDFFKVIVEERQRRRGRDDLESQRLDLLLKTLANSGSFGIHAELNRKELRSGEKAEVTVWSKGEPFTDWQAAPEEPGEWCFPPLAASITGAARLMLAMLERCVTDLGGTYAMCDTDSMAIVATEQDGLIRCPGGLERLKSGRRKPVEAIQALSWQQVESIRQRFAALNPYDRDAVSGSILKLETENFDPGTGERRQLHYYGISAKRYVLFDLDAAGELVLPKVSEHGLGGTYLDPTEKPEADPRGAGDLVFDEDTDDERADDLQNGGRPWVRETWLWLLRRELGLPAPEPAWLRRPAVTRITASSPLLLKTFERYNRGKPASQQVRPFNFLLLAKGDPLGNAPAASLMAPYTTDPDEWEDMTWYDRSAGCRPVMLCTSMDDAHRPPVKYYDWRRRYPPRVVVRSYGSVLGWFASHPELKAAGPDGQPCSYDTVGLLIRRHVSHSIVAPIGKEANRLEDILSGLVTSEREFLTTYGDLRWAEWQLVRSALREMPRAKTARDVGMSERRFRDLLNNDVRPREVHFVPLAWAAGLFADGRLRAWAVLAPLSEGLRDLYLPKSDTRPALRVLAMYAHDRAKRAEVLPECAACGKPFEPTNQQSRYCSKVCRWRAQRERRQAATKASRR